MRYFSTNNPNNFVDFRVATVQGQPADKGLYFPETIPVLEADHLKALRQLSNEEIAFRVLQPYAGDSIEPGELQRIISETVAFDFPLVPVSGSISSLELFHGPTLAFKDVGARFMSRCLGYFARDEKRRITVLVATSGDTGGAVADAFHQVENVEVVILYPSGKVSEVQEKQLTTHGNNITALEVDGTFDDCQKMVKNAFADKTLHLERLLTSANSINVARWLPQQVYYFFAWKQWQHQQPPVISVPSGNFGNICAGLLAWHSGLPVQHFIAACNANDTVPHYLETGNYEIHPAKATLSNAMDVANPSNFSRILQMFDSRFHQLKSIVSAYSISDKETIETIKKVKAEFNYLLDPHGAVGYAALQHYLRSNPDGKGYLLETAHPVKFNTEHLTGQAVEIPGEIGHLLQKEKRSVRIRSGDEDLRDFLMRN